MKKELATAILIAAYILVILYVCFRQIRSSRTGFEPLVPYTHNRIAETAPPDPARSAAASGTAERGAALPPETAPSTKTTASDSAASAPTETATASQTAALSVSYPLNLNTATFEELCTLPGIGEVLARAILEYRTQNGAFYNLRQMLEVPGIGEKRFEAIAGLLYIETKSSLPAETAPPTETQTSDSAAPAPSEPAIAAATTTLSVTYPLNLNTATFEELCTLPGIGEVMARAILEYRTQNGAFYNRRQLLNVPGIGEQRLEAIADLVYIENEQPLPTEAPLVEQPEEPPAEPETEPPANHFINLNTATAEELMQLPGCDAETADAILELRSLIGMFHNPLEIVMAEEVSDAMYVQWSPYLAVDDEGGTQLPMQPVT